MSAATEPAPIKTYTLRIMGDPWHNVCPDEAMGCARGRPEDECPVCCAMMAVNEAEENISDLLPEGYYAKIDEWDR